MRGVTFFSSRTGDSITDCVSVGGWSVVPAETSAVAAATSVLAIASPPTAVVPVSAGASASTSQRAASSLGGVAAAACVVTSVALISPFCSLPPSSTAPGVKTASPPSSTGGDTCASPLVVTAKDPPVSPTAVSLASSDSAAALIRGGLARRGGVFVSPFGGHLLAVVGELRRLAPGTTIFLVAFCSLGFAPTGDAHEKPVMTLSSPSSSTHDSEIAFHLRTGPLTCGLSLSVAARARGGCFCFFLLGGVLLVGVVDAARFRRRPLFGVSTTLAASDSAPPISCGLTPSPAAAVPFSSSALGSYGLTVVAAGASSPLPAPRSCGHLLCSSSSAE